MITIRIDDFPGTKPDEFWKHNLDNFKRFNDIFEKYDINYTIGVIPRWTTQDHIEYLTSNTRAEVALHGIYHDERFPNEFREHETDTDIYNAIMSAKYSLDGCNPYGVNTYIPPHNVIDRKTVDALKSASFLHVWGGPGSDNEVLVYADSIGIKSLYFEPPLEYGRSDELLQRGSVKYIIDKLVAKKDVNMCLHWTWEYNIGLGNLDKYFSTIECKSGFLLRNAQRFMIA